MEIEEHIAALEREGQRLAAAVARADLDAPVPMCPGWTVRELTQHTGRVHRWAAAYVGDGRSERMDDDELQRLWGPVPADAELLAWYRDCHHSIVASLRTAQPDLQCWTFLPAASPLAFWARRQAHETAIHRADAQAVRGGIDGYAAAFAVDGIDELLRAFYARPRNPVRSDPARTLQITATDIADAAWIIHIGSEGMQAELGSAPADAELRGGASELYLALWNRRGLDGLSLTGDATLLDLWRDRATVRWR